MRMSVPIVLLGKGHTLYLDNWYTSPRLVDKLVKGNTDCVGTMSSNRKEFPQTVKSAKWKKGEITAAYRGKQMVMKWKEKRNVIMVSTFHGTEMCKVEKRGGEIVKPTVVHNYNQNMGGVDKSDSLMNISRKIFSTIDHREWLNAGVSSSSGYETRAFCCFKVSIQQVTE
ncbi:hypothetical protein J437_LFUL017585 [Ladona fulva]|uniref:PiggyBac transposable element-derived protein domain-containing protein n=1 Tax=Ladona fulva TaxID=123851 RepID=A0A8K0P9Y5_LADFU|nr:hypothetical protein J437_LFUL017585 [Ladona fulva]